MRMKFSDNNYNIYYKEFLILFGIISMAFFPFLKTWRDFQGFSSDLSPATICVVKNTAAVWSCDALHTFIW
jgi:hypothetical protein